MKQKLSDNQKTQTVPIKLLVVYFEFNNIKGSINKLNTYSLYSFIYGNAKYAGM